MAKNSKRKRTDRQKFNYSNYEDSRREEKNRIAKLARHVKKFPLDFLAASKLANFEKNGVPHRRKNRSHGIKLTEDMKRILHQTGNRLSRAKVALLGVLNNPAKRRPASSMNLDLVNNLTTRHTRVKYKTSMQLAMEKARAKAVLA